MISVIIPALNEEDTIGKVVKFCYASPLVSEVIVVDDQSSDATREEATAAGARVIVSAERGKGVSMQEGVEAAAYPLLVFLDADIDPYPQQTIEKLVKPLLNNEADFVKGAFARNAGRVTELVAKPLLNIFYPELSKFQQPLSGMIAGKKTFFRRIHFFRDYGVDIGILIDMFLMQARITEVNIGYIENKSKPWQMLGKMSGEVAKAIIRRATLRQDNYVTLDELGTVNIITKQLESVMKEEMKSLRKMFVFDMDNTLLQGRFIDTCARHFGFTSTLTDLRHKETDAAVRTKRIAQLLKGLPMGELLKVADSLPLVKDAIEVVEQLKANGNVVVIISDSYQFVTELVKNKIGADFSIGNRLEFFEGKCTGEVIIPSWFYDHPESRCNHSLCKTHALLHLARKYDISPENCVAIGDSENDRCMITHAGLGIAFCTEDDQLKAVADRTIDEPSFASLLRIEGIPMKKGSMLQV